MKYISSVKLFGIIALSFVGCAHVEPKTDSPKPIAFYIFIPHLCPGKSGEKAVRAQYREFLDHLGHASQYGSVGVALNYPYTAFLVGDRPNNFSPDRAKLKLYEINVRVAHEMGLPVMVGFNGGPWAEVSGPFNAYWKTVDGGSYLARYVDGQVNESVKDRGAIEAPKLKPYLGAKPYDNTQSANTLSLTLSPSAESLRKSRVAVLDLALHEWKQIDEKYPHTIQAFTTDSEVSDFSFRSLPSGDSLPIGYEGFMTKPYCREYKINDCVHYFENHHFTYENDEDRKWFYYRAQVHRQFVSDTVNHIRAQFPTTPIYTHQLGTLDNVLIEPYRKQDFASPLETAFVPNAIPGITAYIYGKRDQNFRTIIDQFSAKARDHEWALTEFNPGKDWKGTRSELADYTREMIEFLASRKVSAVALLAWNSNALDAGIKDSGVDDGIRKFLEQDEKHIAGRN